MAQKCVHQGCGKTYTDEDEVCRYHPGPPIFHEGQKGSVSLPIPCIPNSTNENGRAAVGRCLGSRGFLSVTAKLTTTSTAQDGSAASRVSLPLRSS